MYISCDVKHKTSYPLVGMNNCFGETFNFVPFCNFTGFMFSHLQFYLNNTLALETTWISPEEMGIFQRQEKPLLRTNQTALSICRPAAASRNIHTLLLTPRRISGRRENLRSQHPLSYLCDSGSLFG